MVWLCDPNLLAVGELLGRVRRWIGFCPYPLAMFARVASVVTVQLASVGSLSGSLHQGR